MMGCSAALVAVARLGTLLPVVATAFQIVMQGISATAILVQKPMEMETTPAKWTICHRKAAGAWGW
jgi:hypothetical protein